MTQGVFYRSYHTFGRASIAALEIARPLYCRMLGASRITLYFKTNASPKSYSMFFIKRTRLRWRMFFCLCAAIRPYSSPRALNV
ncbi:MAG: hypothetical protein ACLR7U_05740 [Ruthenibacterium lactatiformans]